MNGDNKGVTLLKSSLFQIHVLRTMLVRGPEVDILREIHKGMRGEGVVKEPVYAAAQQLWRNHGHGQIHLLEWGKTDSLLTLVDVSMSQMYRTSVITSYCSTMTLMSQGTLAARKL